MTAATSPTVTRIADGYYEYKHAYGTNVYKKSIAGIFYKKETPEEVVKILDNAYLKKENVRLFLGDPVTGQDWFEESDVEGKIGRSMGEIKIPLMIKKGEDGGPGISESSIVRIQIRGVDVYRHPKYHQGVFELRAGNDTSHPLSVFVDNKNIANFKSEKTRDRFIAFIKGEPKKKKEPSMSM